MIKLSESKIFEHTHSIDIQPKGDKYLNNAEFAYDKYIFSKLQKENNETPAQDSTAFILAQIERQNALLEKDPKSIVIQSNKLKAHFSIMQKLVKDNSNRDEGEEVDWGFWEAVIQDSDQIAIKLPHLFALKLRSGIPTRVRGLIWQAMSKSSSVHLETVYGQLCKEKSPHERIIQRDLARTFPRIDMFKQENGQGQNSMKRILEAYSLYDTDVGYCQGLAFLVGPLLLNMPETQSFCVFVRLMETYEMRSMFTLNMEGLHLRLYQFSSLLKEILPDLTQHLDQYGIHPAMYASQWFLTLFAYVFPMELVDRIYDIVFAEGAAETIMRVAIAMLKQSERIILFNTNTEFEDILDYLTSRKLCEPYVNSYNQVIHDAMSLSDIITRSKLQVLNDEYNHMKSSKNIITTTGKFSFWRRKNADASNMKRSASTIQPVINVSRPPILAKRWSSVSAPKECSYSSNSSIVSDNDNQTIEQLKKELQELKEAHQKTLRELDEIQYDKQNLENESIVLKLTIQQLENSKLSEHDTRCTKESMNDINGVIGIPNSPIYVSPLSTTMLTLTGSNSTDDDDDVDPGTPSSSIHDYYDNEFSDRFVKLKVENFELEQKCEGLTFDLELAQSKLDMLNEGQVALFDKMIAMKSEMEDLTLENQEKTRESQRLKLENETLQSSMKHMKTMFTNSFSTSMPSRIVRRHSLPCIRMDKTEKLQWNTSTFIKDKCIGQHSKRKSSIYGRVLNAFGKSSQSTNSTIAS